MALKIISFELCPFVQRSVITLLEKGMEYEIDYLSLEELINPPSWFRDISPFGKVPVLRVGDTSLFESAVIMEYLDELSSPSLHPEDPLVKALDRAWIVFGEELLFSQYRYSTAADEASFKENQQQIEDGLQRLEATLGQEPFFHGGQLSLIDAAYAPFFMRLDILETQHRFGFYDNKPRISRWARALGQRESVKNSVIADLPEKYLDYIANSGEYAAGVFAKHPASA